jgi:hypothetical protein
MQAPITLKGKLSLILRFQCSKEIYAIVSTSPPGEGWQPQGKRKLHVRSVCHALAACLS